MDLCPLPPLTVLQEVIPRVLRRCNSIHASRESSDRNGVEEIQGGMVWKKYRAEWCGRNTGRNGVEEIQGGMVWKKYRAEWNYNEGNEFVSDREESF
ncbi:hypothetical protein BgiBS90_027608 [Biomphalaria glabrata]|nr:hypothetical protein BgiBS90_027608 [Biomphalaria glabrata]